MYHVIVVKNLSKWSFSISLFSASSLHNNKNDGKEHKYMHTVALTAGFLYTELYASLNKAYGKHDSKRSYVKNGDS